MVAKIFGSGLEPRGNVAQSLRAVGEGGASGKGAGVPKRDQVVAYCGQHGIIAME